MQFGAGRGNEGVVIMLTLGTGIGSAIFFKGLLLPNTELGHLEIRGKDAELRASDRTRHPPPDSDTQTREGVEFSRHGRSRLERSYQRSSRARSGAAFIRGRRGCS